MAGECKDTVLTLREVAALLKVADKTVYTMAQRRELPGFKVRGQWRFKPADLDQWIEERKAAARKAAKKGSKA
ncbi:MAG: helix-turn-helix domain-containing protein [Pseudolabrys sp.]|nr:helix-turn-helix domain-containing protein [Pseudolabrys sp.]